MRRLSAKVVLAGMVLAALVLASGFASSRPDGLERVATDHGLATAEDHPAAEGPLSGYETDGIEDPWLSVGVAGLAGSLVVLLLVGGVVLVLRRRPARQDD